MMQVSYVPNKLSVTQGGSLLSYLRGLSVPLTEYFLCISPTFFLLCFFLLLVNDGWIERLHSFVLVNQVVKLYERCLIACANYPEYWVRYVLSMEASENMDLANNALARATQVFVKVGLYICDA